MIAGEFGAKGIYFFHERSYISSFEFQAKLSARLREFLSLNLGDLFFLFENLLFLLSFDSQVVRLVVCIYT